MNAYKSAGPCVIGGLRPLRITHVPEEDGTEGGRTEKESSESGKAETDPSAQGRLVVIDAGHQQKGNSEKEPIGPGAEQTKAKVAGGTSGCVSGLHEYDYPVLWMPGSGSAHIMRRYMDSAASGRLSSPRLRMNFPYGAQNLS